MRAARRRLSSRRAIVRTSCGVRTRRSGAHRERARVHVRSASRDGRVVRAHSQIVRRRAYSLWARARSLYVLWRVTGDRKYVEWGWKIFENLRRECRHQNGYVRAGGW